MKVVDAGLIATSMRDIGRVRLHRPVNASQAVKILCDPTRKPAIVAGATDLCAKFNAGLVATDLIWLGQMEGRERIAYERGSVSVGAGCTHAHGANDITLAERFSDLQAAWRTVAWGVERVREWGTIGGNLMARRTRYEMLILMAAVGAVLHFETPAGRVAIAAREFWEEGAPESSFLADIGMSVEGVIALRYDRSLRPIMTLATCIRLSAGGYQAVAVVATQSLPPVAILLDPVASIQHYRNESLEHAKKAMRQLPENFYDIQSARAYLARAGTALLRRHLEDMGNA